MAQLQSTSITGSLIVTQGITGSFSGSISNATSASYAATASYALNAGDSVWTGSAGNIYYNGGNVGIGTASPGGKLDVNGETLFRNRITVNSTAVQTYAQLNVWDTTTGTGTTRIADFTNGIDNNLNIYISQVGASSKYSELASYSSNPLVFNYTAGGNVGIGTTNPTGQLTVAKQYSSYTPGEYLLKLRGGNGGIYDLVDAYYDSDAAIFRVGYAGLNNSRAVINGGTSAGGASLSLVYGSTLTTFITADGTSYFNGGNVGIGATSTSGYKLYVAGDTWIGGTTNYIDGTTILRTAGASEVMRVASSGNVGIGITTPGASLHIAKNATYNNVTSTALRVANVTSPNKAIDFGYDNTADVGYIQGIEFGVAAKNLSLQSDGGNVGIGTTSPGSKLTVIGDIATSTRVASDTINGYTGGSTPLTIQTGGSQNIIFGTNNTERARISTAGNVGIGTTSPTQKLEVAGYGLFQNGVVGASGLTLYGDNSSATGMVLTTSGNVGIGTGSPNARLTVVANDSSNPNVALRLSSTAYSGVSYPYTSIRFGSAYSSYPSWNLASIDAGYTGTSWGGSLLFYTNNDSGETNLTERMRITSGGNVGIGTTNPTTPLRVEGGGAMTGGWNKNTTLAATYPVLIFNSNASKWAGIGYDYSEGLRVWLNATSDDVNTVTPQFNILNNGNVGINTTSPGYKLEVNGTLGVSGNATFNGSNVYINSDNSFIGNNTTDVVSLSGGTVYLPGNGNVGIGTTAPSTKLHIYESGAKDAELLITSTYADGYDAQITLENTHTGGRKYELLSTNDSRGIIGGGKFAINDKTAGDSVARLVIDSSGNVGIGTTSPGALLDVNGSLNSGKSIIRVTNSDTANYITVGAGIPGISNAGMNLTLDGTSRMVISAAGNVGINTTSPASKLEVSVTPSAAWMNLINANETAFRLTAFNNGTNNGSSTYAFKYGLYYATTENATVTFYRGGSSVGGFLTFTTDNGNERMRIAGDGNVGIGITNPPDQFSVGKSTGTSISVTSNFAAGTSGSPLNIDLNFRGYADNKMAMIRSWDESASTGNGYLTFWTNNPGVGFAERMRIDNTGNVGIGTTAPSQKLVVNGRAIVGGGLTGDALSISTSIGTYTFNGYDLLTPSSFLITAGSSGYLSLDGYPVIFKVSGGERMRVNTDGNVGIGNTAPAFKLDVNGTVRFSAEAYIAGVWSTSYGPRNSGDPIKFVDWNATELVRINTTNGNVGIGTTSSGYKLHVNGTSYFADTIYNGGGHISWTAGYSDGTTQTYNGNSLAFLTNSSSYTARMFITSGGNVGIGTTSPAALLHVSQPSANTVVRIGNNSNYDQSILFNGGNDWSMGMDYSNSNAFVLSNYSSLGTNDRLVVTTGGNVGVGTTSPAGKLSISTPTAYDGTILQLQSRDEPTAYNLKINEVVTSGVVRWSFDMTNSSAYSNVLVFDRGNVGIGTTTPAVTLQVDASGGGLIRATRTSAGSGYIQMEADGTNGTLAANNILYLNAGGSTKMTVLSGGNVGIGTTNPAGKLSIEGDGTEYSNIVFKQSAAQEHLIYASANYQYNLIGSGAPVWIWGQQGASERMRLDSTGLGIGTTSPSAKLQTVSSGLGDGGGIRITNSGAGGDDYRIWPTATVNGEGAGKLIFTNNGGNVLTLTSGGNVGIGTTSPNKALTVYGGNDNGIWIDSNGNQYTTLALGRSGVEKVNFAWDNTNSILGTVTYGASSMTFSPNSTEAMRIANGGNVGIGTTNPSQLLHIVGTNGANNGITLQNTNASGNSQVRFLNTSGTERAAITYINGSDAVYHYTAGGGNLLNLVGANVGIGTASPTAKLHTDGTTKLGGGTLQVSTDQTFTTNYSYTFRDAVGINNPNSLSAASATTVMSIGSMSNGVSLITTGNVGIGTTSPTQKLEVDGNIKATKVLINTTNAGYTLYSAGESRINDVILTNSADTDYIQKGAGAGAFYVRSAIASGVMYVGANNSSNLFENYLKFDGGANTAVLRTNGTDRVYIASSGNVGIGVTAPAAKLQVSGSTNVLNVRGSGSAVTSSIFSVDGNNGRLFEVSDDLSNSLFSVNTIAGLPVIEAFADYTVTMGTYGAYSLQVTGSRVGVGTSSPGYPLHVSGSVSGISIYATNDIAAFSDQSVKTDLQVIDSAVDRIKQINGYTYVRVDDLSNTRRAGVIAQEVQKVLPEVVSENSDGTLNVAYSNMIALLIEGMKEQQAQIDKLREDLEDLRYEL